jgi:hypothetical protein
MQEEFKNNNGVIRTHKSKGRQHNDQQKKEQITNNDLQNPTNKSKDRVTRTPLRTQPDSSSYYFSLQGI